MPALLTAAVRSVRAVAADVVYLAVGTALYVPGDARALARRALTAAAGDRAACGVLGCEHGPAATVGGHQVRSCVRCGLTPWEAAASPAETETETAGQVPASLCRSEAA